MFYAKSHRAFDMGHSRKMLSRFNAWRGNAWCVSANIFCTFDRSIQSALFVDITEPKIT